MVVHVCNPSHLRDGDQEDHSLKMVQGRPHLNKKKMGVVVYACHSSYRESASRRIMMQAGWNKNIRPYLKINQSKKQ
jgi:hypothetical protein